MRTLIAVATCLARTHQADAQRMTWANGAEDVRFFVGGAPGYAPRRKDEVVLTVDDSYRGLPAKVRAIMRWALERGYEAVMKVDDDTYVVLSRLLQAGLERFDYAGNFRMHNGNYPHDYASGFAYRLSRRAAEAIAQAELTEDTFEDRWVGNVLGATRGMTTFDEKRFSCPYPTGVEAAPKLWGSNLGKECIAIAQYPADKFAELHSWYRRCFVDNRME